MLVTEVFDPYKAYDLTEPKSKKISKVDNPAELATILKKFSPVFVQAYLENGYKLYRGVSDAARLPWGMPIVTGVRPDRKSVQMGRAEVEVLEKFFKSQGLTVTRQNSIFCTPKRSVSEDWGRAYIVFPKEPWTMLAFMHSSMKDTYAFFQHRGIASQLLRKTDEGNVIASAMFKALKPVEFTNAAGVSALVKTKTRYEVLLKTSSYIGLQVSSNFTEAVLKELEK